MKNGALNPIMLQQQRIIAPTRRGTNSGHCRRRRPTLPQMFRTHPHPLPLFRLRRRRNRGHRRRRRRRRCETFAGKSHVITISLGDFHIQRLNQFQILPQHLLREPLRFRLLVAVTPNLAPEASRAVIPAESGGGSQIFDAELDREDLSVVCRVVRFLRRSSVSLSEHEDSEAWGGPEKRNGGLRFGYGLDWEDLTFGDRFGRRQR